MRSCRSKRCLASLCVLGLSALSAHTALAAPPVAAAPAGMKVVDALDREALKVRSIARSMMIGAALAGTRVVAVGERGSIALSDDGGQTWRQARRVPVSVTLTAVRFVNELAGWATGHGGVVLHTEDAGETWVRQLDGLALVEMAQRDAQALGARLGAEHPDAVHALRDAKLLAKDGADKPLLDLAFSDERHGVVVGAYNLIFATADGGQTWQSWMGRTGNTKALHLYAIAWQGDDLCLAGEQGLLLRSTDAGQSFSRVSLPYQGSWFGLAIQADRSLIVAGLKGNAYRVPASGEAVRLSAPGHGSFVSVVRAAPNRTLLATQSGQLFAALGNDKTLRALPLSQPLPPLTGVLPLSDQQLLALTLQGLQRASFSGTAP